MHVDQFLDYFLRNSLFKIRDTKLSFSVLLKNKRKKIWRFQNKWLIM